MLLELKISIMRRYLTQVDFATVTGVSAPCVSEVINERRKMPAGEQVRWAAILDCPPETIFPGYAFDAQVVHEHELLHEIDDELTEAHTPDFSGVSERK